jgi:hypothetical protein
LLVRRGWDQAATPAFAVGQLSTVLGAGKLGRRFVLRRVAEPKVQDDVAHPLQLGGAIEGGEFLLGLTP